MGMIDITRALADGGLVYPGDEPIRVERICEIGPDCAYRLMSLAMPSHAMTHLDAPAHFVEEGLTVDRIPLERLMGTAIVVEVTEDRVRVDDLPSSDKIVGKNILFKTRHSGAWAEAFDENHVFIEEIAARALAESGANLVGIDYLDVERYGDEGYPVHRTLLGAGVLILEGVDLSQAPAGEYELIVMPLKIAGGDGAPCRALLRD